MENIGAKRSKRQTLADKVAHVFIISVIFIAISVYFYYVKSNPDFAMLTAISIIIVSCPCALGLAMPVTISLGSSIGINKGILFKHSDAFENLTKINHMVFDKTGTVTSGKMKLTTIKPLTSLTENELLEIASAIERYSEHPTAFTIVTEANIRKVNLKKATDFISYPGKGVKGLLDKVEYFIGNKSFLQENGIHVNISSNDFWETMIFIGSKDTLLGYFILKDKIRDNTFETIKLLKSKGIELTLLSGDKKQIAENIGKQLGIPNVISEVLPDQKSDYIAKLRKQGFKVAMIGDGVNDAPAMVQADVGIAMCANNDLANMNADIVILNQDFSSILDTVKLAFNINDKIKQNMLISLIYNLLVIPVAATGYISPLAAAILMPLSSLMVLFNTTRIAGRK